MAGRKPKPTAIKELEGNPGKRKLNNKEPKPDKGIPVCPEWLLPEAKAEWKRLSEKLNQMGVLTEVGMATFAAYCQSYARWKDAQEHIDSGDSTFETEKGYQLQALWVGIVNTNQKLMLQAAAEFGLTPSVRTRLDHEFQACADKILGNDDKFLRWICETCNGKYYDSIGNMANGVSVCPYCSNKKALPGFNDLITRHPNLINEVYSIGNYLIGTDLSKCLDNCTKTTYWICVECDNIYPMKIVDRVIKIERGHNPCPRYNYISKKQNIHILEV